MKKLLTMIAVLAITAHMASGQAILDEDFTGPGADTTDLGWDDQDSNRSIGDSIHYSGSGDIPQVMRDDAGWMTEIAGSGALSGTIDFRPAADRVNYITAATIHEDLSKGTENGSGFNPGFVDSTTGYSYSARIVLSAGATQASYQSGAVWQADQAVVENPSNNYTGDFSEADNGLIFEHKMVWRPVEVDVDGVSMPTLNLEMYRKAPTASGFSKFVDAVYDPAKYGAMPTSGTIDQVTVMSKGRDIGGGQVEGVGITAGSAQNADFDLDGTVGSSDFSILSTNWGTASGAGLLTGDADNDEAVGSADFSALSTQWGSSAAIAIGGDDRASVEVADDGSLVLTTSTSIAGYKVYVGFADGDVVDDTDVLSGSQNGHLTWGPGTLKEYIEGTSVFEGLGSTVLEYSDFDTGIDVDWDALEAAGVELWLATDVLGETTQYSQVVPEPATMALLGLGGLALIRRRRRA